MQYRPFWFRLFDPRVTGGIIVVAIFFILQSVANVFALVNTVGQQDLNQSAIHLAAAVIFGLPALGLLKLKRRARQLSIALALVMVVQGGIMMLFINLLEGMVTVVLYGLAGIYLLSEKCRQVFYPPAAQESEQQPEEKK